MTRSYKKYGKTVKNKWYEMNEIKGIPFRAIAREYGVSPQTVAKAIREIEISKEV